MTTQASGPNPSLTDKVNEINDWQQSLFSPEVWGYINLTREQLQKLTAKECEEISFILDQQAFYLQTKSNKIRACLKWANDHLDLLIIQEIDQYRDKWKYEERRLCVIRGNDYLTKFWRDVSKVEEKKEAIDFLSNRVDSISRSLRNVRYGKSEYSQAKTGD